MMSLIRIVTFALAAFGFLRTSCADEQIVLLPPDFQLSGAAARQQLLVERKAGEHFIGENTAGRRVDFE